MTLCASCCEPFVEADDVLDCSDHGEWTLRMSCRSCNWFGTVVADDDAIDELTVARDLATEAIAHAAEELAIELFAAAIRENLILPEDF